MEATTSDRNGAFPCPAGCGRFFLNLAGATSHAKSCAWIEGCGRGFQSTSEVDSFRTALKSAGRYDEAMDLAHAWLSTWIKHLHEKNGDWHSAARGAAVTVSSTSRMVSKCSNSNYYNLVDRQKRGRPALPCEPVYAALGAIIGEFSGESFTSTSQTLCQKWQSFAVGYTYTGMDKSWTGDISPLACLVHKLIILSEIDGRAPPAALERIKCMFGEQSAKRGELGGMMELGKGRLGEEVVSPIYAERLVAVSRFSAFKLREDNSTMVCVMGVLGANYLKLAQDNRMPTACVFHYPYSSGDLSFENVCNGAYRVRDTEQGLAAAKSRLPPHIARVLEVVDAHGYLPALAPHAKPPLGVKRILEVATCGLAKLGLESAVLKTLDVVYFDAQDLVCYGKASAVEDIKSWTRDLLVTRELQTVVSELRSGPRLPLSQLLGGLSLYEVTDEGAMVEDGRNVYSRGRRWVPASELTPGKRHKAAKKPQWECCACGHVWSSDKPTKCSQCQHRNWVSIDG